MNIIIYIVIFLAKTVELALGTLRLIVVANGKKVMGTILQGIASFVWLCVTGFVVTDITSDPIKVVVYALGSAFGSYVGSVLEEKMALGSNMLLAIIDKDLEEIITNTIRSQNFAVTVLEGRGKEKERSVLMIMVARKKRKQVTSIIKKIDSTAMIISETAATINGGHNGNEKSKN